MAAVDEKGRIFTKRQFTPRENPRLQPLIKASAPGRICLFGEHQDYLNLPVIAAAIDLRVGITATPRADAWMSVSLPDIGETLQLDPNQNQSYRHDRDYLPAAVNVLRRAGLRWRTGWDVTVQGSIPLNSGASSSSALQVAWCAFLMAAAGDVTRAHDPMQVALAAHQSEVTEFGSPGGKMDHFSSAYGGLIWLDTAANEVKHLMPWPDEFVLVDSGIPKDTNGLLGETRKRVENLGVDLSAIPAIISDDDLVSLLNSIAEDRRPLLAGTLMNRALTVQAKALLEGPHDSVALGRLLDRHHAVLSEKLGVSHCEIDRLLDHGRRAGALGGKINGSGGGGSFFLLAAPGQAGQLMKEYEEMGLRAWVVRAGSGVEVK